MPVVSVVISAKDAEKTLLRSLASTLQSDFADFEVVLIDDGSTDKTLEIAQSVRETARHLRIIENPTNLGLSASLNKGIASCDSKYIVRLDADDLMSRDRLTTQVRFLDENRELGICGSGAVVIDEFDRPIGVSPPKAFSPTISWVSLWRVPFFHPSVCVRRELFSSDGFAYNSKDTLGFEDYQLWSNMLGRHRGWNFVKPLIYYRKHSGQLTANKLEAREKAYYALSQKMIAQHLGLNLSDLEAKQQWGFSRGSFDPDVGIPNLKEAIELRERCVEIASKSRSDGESAETGFGVDLIVAARFTKSASLSAWILSSRFRRRCIRKSFRVFPSYSYYRCMRGSWATTPETDST